MKGNILFWFAMTTFGCMIASAANSKSAFFKKYWDNLEKSDYSNSVLPTSSRGVGKPIDITCFLHLEVFEVDDAKMEFTAKIHLNQEWNDSRLAFQDASTEYILFKDEKLVWTPDIQLWEEKYGYQSPPQHFLMSINRTGAVTYHIERTVVFSCLMDFRNYPHDTQNCQIQLVSYDYKRDEVELAWDMRYGWLTSYEPYLLQYRFKNMSRSYDSFDGGWSSGWTVLKTELTFQREFAFFVRNLYGPFVILTALTWLSFWIPVKLMAPRLYLLVSLMILMLVVHYGFELKANPPQTSYAKGSDVWIAVCESMVFSTFLEFIVVHCIAKLQEESSKCDQEKSDADPKVNQSEETSNNSVIQIIVRLKRDVQLSSRIDKVCRILFPAVFAGFNIAYWTIYCT